MATQSYERTWRSLSCIGGRPNTFALEWFPYGWLDKLVVKQVGAEDGNAFSTYTVKIFNSKKPGTNDSESSGGVDPTAESVLEASPETYLVVPPYEGLGASATLMDFFPSGARRYQNMDGTPNPSAPTKWEGYIYVQITPDVGNDSTWDVTLGGYTESPR